MFVSNTSTLVLLAKIRCLELFMSLVDWIEIPLQVKFEALFDKESYYAKLIEKFIANGKIRVIPVRNAKIKLALSEFRLDEGEAAAYALFDRNKHKAILTDDGELIKLCRLQEIPFICAMAIIIRLYEARQIRKEEVLGKLEELYKIGRYSKEIYEHFKAEVK